MTCTRLLAHDVRFLASTPAARILFMRDDAGRPVAYHALAPFSDEFRAELVALGWRTVAVVKPRRVPVVEVSLVDRAQWRPA